MILTQKIKLNIAKILLCVYLFALFKPVSPIIIDVFEHTFLKAKHMATMHFKHGHHHNHLHEELINEEEDHHHDEKGEGEVVFFSIKSFEDHLTTQIINIKPYFQLSGIIPFCFKESLEDVFIKKNSPPPKV